jgi:hypothetical protein
MMMLERARSGGFLRLARFPSIWNAERADNGRKERAARRIGSGSGEWIP